MTETTEAAPQTAADIITTMVHLERALRPALEKACWDELTFEFEARRKIEDDHRAAELAVEAIRERVLDEALRPAGRWSGGATVTNLTEQARQEVAAWFVRQLKRPQRIIARLVKHGRAD